MSPLSDERSVAWHQQPWSRALGVSALATSLSWACPPTYGALAVAAAFLTAAYFFTKQAPERYGMELGGLFTDRSLSWRRVAREVLETFAWALALSAVVFPLYWLAFRWHWQPRLSFSLSRALSHGFEGSPWALLDFTLGQFVVVALPEEAFFRGYVQSDWIAGAKDRTSWKARWGAIVGTSAIFAVGHLATIPAAGRLAVFFPSLLFGWLRIRSGGIGLPLAFHALCNVFSALLSAGYGLG